MISIVRERILSEAGFTRSSGASHEHPDEDPEAHQPAAPAHDRRHDRARPRASHSQRSHIESRIRFAALLKRSPDTATAHDICAFQKHVMASGCSISNRNPIMTGLRFLLKVTLRRHDLAAAIYHLKEPLKLPQVLAPDEIKREPKTGT